METSPRADKKIIVLSIVLSIILPGLGHVVRKKWLRGISIFCIVGSALVFTLWHNQSAWLAIPIVLWLWNVWDVAILPKGAPIVISALLWLGMAYGIGWQVTEIDFGALFNNPERANAIILPMLKPDFLEEQQIKKSASVTLELPCGRGSSQPAEVSGDGMKVTIDTDCVFIDDPITITAEGLWGDFPVQILWLDQIDGRAGLWNINSDANGKFSYTITVPARAQNQAVDLNLPQKHRLVISQSKNIGGIEISQNGLYILKGIGETLGLALLATTLGALLALPISFLAAQNLMGGNYLTRIIYYLVRAVLNIFRSIEALIMAVIFVTIVGLGPFAGMLAVTLHTIAALGKLYSEVIEGIDPGPIEAIRATGANWVEIIRYAVIPQIVPSFTALTIYRWDINVRSSTIIGMVGGGGLGFYLFQWMNLSDYRAVSSCFIAIALVVIVMDFFSARLRERIK
jgi:phosphonate transport system permease protein